MKERPILFSAPMVRAILEGRKTMTRRVVKPQPPATRRGRPWCSIEDLIASCPYGIPGDRLWVRETFRTVGGGHPIYRADDNRIGVRWKPAIHMRRVYSRILLEITDVRVERLQDITEDGAKLEGAKPSFLDGNDIVSVVPFYRDGFMHLWNDINGPGSWDANPWVWCVSFKRLKP